MDNHLVLFLFCFVREDNIPLFSEFVRIIQQMGQDEAEMVRIRVGDVLFPVTFDPVFDIRFPVEPFQLFHFAGAASVLKSNITHSQG